MANFDILQSTQFKVKKLSIVSNGGTFDITSLFEEISFFDTILFPAASGNIVIVDSKNLSSKIDFKSCFLRLEISKDDESDGPTVFKKTFRIYKQSNRIIKNQTTEAYVLSFVSQELIESITYSKDNTKISSAFQGLYSDVARIIIKDYLKTPRNKIGTIEATKGVHEFIIPNLSPFDAMNWLARRSITKDNLPNYIFFENKSGFNFVSLTSLLKGKSVATRNFDVKNIGKPENELFGARHVTIVSQYNLIKAIKDGMYSGVHVAYDSLTQSYIETPFNINKITDNSNSNENLNLSTLPNRHGLTVTQSKGSRVVVGHSSEQRQKSNYIKQNDSKTATVVDDSENYLFARKSIFANLLQKRIRITVPGNFIYSSGLNVNLKGFNLTQNDRNDTKDTSTYGKYMIIAVRHTLRPDTFETIIEVASDTTNSPVIASDNAQVREALKE
jgi:hypothetical protein